jgi:hypothetical protein
MTALERLADLAGGMMLDTARVTGVSRLSDDFVRVELSADAFLKVTWVPPGRHGDDDRPAPARPLTAPRVAGS